MTNRFVVPKFGRA